MNENPTRIYVMVADPGGIDRFFKIGYSSQLLDRVRTIQTGCPMPITGVMNVVMPDRFAAQEAESRFHIALHGYRVSGEWFKFDLGNPSHKDDFHRVSKIVLDRHLGTGWRWEVANQKKLREYLGSYELAAETRSMDIAYAFHLAKRMNRR